MIYAIKRLFFVASVPIIGLMIVPVVLVSIPLFILFNIDTLEHYFNFIDSFSDCLLDEDITYP